MIDGNVSQYAQFPDLTWDEAINELYEFVKREASNRLCV